MGLDDLTKIVNRTRLFPCSYGFVKEKGSIKKPAYEYDLSILRQQQTSKKSQWPQVVSLDWRIGDQNCSRARLNSTYACQANSHCVDFCAETSGYLCNCSQGYTGNPYLYQGCTDINECDDNPCGPHSQCKNVPGSFSCTCDSGYNGDGKKGESGCTNTIKFVLIGLGSALGLLQLLLLCFWLRKVFEKRKNRKRKEDLFKHLLLLQKQTANDMELEEEAIVSEAKDMEYSWTSHDHCNGTWRYRRGINLSKTQYTLSENNWLIAVGCDDFGETITFRGQESFLDPGHLDACVGFCSGNRSAVGVCPNNDDSNSVGEGCCRVPMAKGTWYLSIGLFDLTKIVNRKRLFPCSYAFVKEKGIINKPTYTYDSSILQQSSAAFSQKNQWQQVVSLDWRIGDRNCSRARRNSTYACQANSHCVDFGADIEGYLCNCSHGYVGNPYLYPGCTDINECDDNPCAPHAQCKNVPGSFSCTCDSGYNGDGKKGGSGCTSSIKFVLIGLGSALGLLLLILLCFYMRKVFEKRKNRKRKEDLFKHLLLLQKQTVLSQSHPANDMELEEEAIVSEAKDVEFSDIEYSWTSHDHGIASSSSDAHPLMSKD
ncbi:hypothetical protein SASPL_139148 [Salvia splendens]|uniref:EGF-like domain-containing protein n=1 Tax=Salvia splendens TaxID=180675 RepID=A0A8X8WYD7_SALSN|nr:hypothetical protein SASPL_139148 [Salvia splendens]